MKCCFCGAELKKEEVFLMPGREISETGRLVCTRQGCPMCDQCVDPDVWELLIDSKKVQDALKAFNDKILTIDIVSGCEGKSIYIDDYRVAGNKPWGGGTRLATLHCRGKDIIDAIPELKITSITKEEE